MKKGSNHTKTLNLTETIAVGRAVIKTSADDIRNIKAADNAVPYGILGQRYDQDLDGSKASGEKSITIVEGYTCAWIENDGNAHFEGELLYGGSGATVNDGYLSFTKPTETLDSSEPFAELVDSSESGATVGIIKILR